MEEITTQAPDGYPVHGWIVRPEGPGPHPVLLMIHGGPATQYGWRLFDESQVYAGAGDAVILGNPRGSSGYGQAHGTSIFGDAATIAAADLLALLDAGLATGGLDSSRVGVLGGSYGGYMTTWLAAHHGDRFKAAISERAVNAIDSFHGSSDIGWFFAGALFGADPAGWTAQNPLSFADQISLPMLIIHSEHDWRCPVEQAQRLFVALKLRGVPTEMLLFPGEGHGLSRGGRPRHREARFEAVLDWWAASPVTASSSMHSRPAMAMSALRPGDPQQLGTYEVLGRLGAGGQGVVYLGQTADDERVAIKVLHYDVDEAFLIRELTMMRQVASFCTARVLDAQVTGNTWYIVSEYIDGRSLADVVDNDGPMTGGSLERLAIGTVTALTAIHQAGVIHRDFKPANILLGPDGPRVIDFGIARTLDLTITAGEIRGTPAYMAPEQINGKTAGTAADMFAWAATMSYAATGRSPFGSDTLPAIIMRVLQEDPNLRELTWSLREVVAACLAKDQAARPAAPEVLIRLLGHNPSRPDPGSARRHRTRRGRRPGRRRELPGLDPATAAGLSQPPASHPPPAYPPVAPWPARGPSSGPPRQRSGKLTRFLVPIAAVVIVALGAVVGLALTGVFSSAKQRIGATGHSGQQWHQPTRPAGPTPRPARRRPRQPGAGPHQPGPVNTSPAPVQTPTPVRTSTPAGTPTPVPTPTAPPGNGPVSAIPLDLGGQWTGIGHQPGDAQTPTYTIVMTLSGGGTTGSTSYSSLGCQGHLTLMSGSTANSVQLREQITSGGCTTTGVFTVHRQSGKLIFSYEPGGTGPASYGTLHS